MAPAGPHPNTTSARERHRQRRRVTGNAANDSLRISGLEFTKEFIGDPSFPGSTVTLRFTIDNISPVSDATDILFTDSLDDTLEGLAAIGLPANDVCGSGSSINGTSSLFLLGGNLLAGEMCTFDITLQIPGGAGDGPYPNVTSSLSATMEGNGVLFDPATDTLEIASVLLSLQKEFTDDPVPPGGNVTLEFTLTNLDQASAASSIAFTDDLDAVIEGLVAIGLPAADVCGAGSAISGTDLLTFTGGSLAAGGDCTFSVTLQVPVDAIPGTIATNVTSEVSGLIDGFAATGDPATAELIINSYSFSKSFDGPVSPGGTVDLTFSINNDSAATALDLRFTDDLDLVVPGLAATGLPMSDVCGAGSSITGTSFLELLDGTLLPGASCSIVVTLQVPPTAAPGTYLNETSDLREQGLPVADPATADLEVIDFTPPQVTLVDTVQGTGDGELEECETARSDISQFLVTFDEPMFAPGNPADPNSVTNPDNWFLVAAGEDRDITTTLCGVAADDDVEIPVGRDLLRRRLVHRDR